jgi:hypothetical protein
MAVATTLPGSTPNMSATSLTGSLEPLLKIRTFEFVRTAPDHPFPSRGTTVCSTIPSGFGFGTQRAGHPTGCWKLRANARFERRPDDHYSSARPQAPGGTEAAVAIGLLGIRPQPGRGASDRDHGSDRCALSLNTSSAAQHRVVNQERTVARRIRKLLVGTPDGSLPVMSTRLCLNVRCSESIRALAATAPQARICSRNSAAADGVDPVRGLAKAPPGPYHDNTSSGSRSEGSSGMVPSCR